MASTFNTLKKFFPLICEYDVLSAKKLAEMCVDDENKHALFPRAERARARAEAIQRLFSVTRAWCTSELVYAYLFGGEKSVKDCWECMKDLREITLGTAKSEVLQYRNRLDMRFFPAVKVSERIEHQSVADDQTVFANESELNIAEYLFDYCVLIDERLASSKQLINIFNEQLANMENAIYGQTATIGANALQRSFDIDLGKFLNGNKKRFEVPVERFRAFLSIVRPYSVQRKRALEKKIYNFADCLNYMDYLRIGINLTPEEEQLRRELMSVIDDHSGVTVLDRLCIDSAYNIFDITNEDGSAGCVVEELSDEGEVAKTIVAENTDEVAKQEAFIGLHEKVVSLDDMPEKSAPKKRGRPKKEKPEAILPPVPDDSDEGSTTSQPVVSVPEVKTEEQMEKDAKEILEQAVEQGQREMPKEIGIRRLQL